LNQPALQTRLTSLVPAEARGVVLSMNGTILRLGQAVGPLLTGMVLAAFGIDAVFYTSGAAGLALAGGAALLIGNATS
jgi:predicted MFS family arabinose efflux permease